MNTVIIIVSIIIGTALGVISNIVAAIIQPSLEKRRRLVFSLFIGLIFFSIVIAILPKTTAQLVVLPPLSKSTPQPTPTKIPRLPTPISVPAEANFILKDTTTQGNWQGRFGGDGYDIANIEKKFPGYVQLDISNTNLYTSSYKSTDIDALQSVTANERVRAFLHSNVINVNCNFTDGQTHQLALYFWYLTDVPLRQRVDVIDTKTERLLYSQELIDFGKGVYLVWQIQGDITIKVTELNPGDIYEAFLSGIFFD